MVRTRLVEEGVPISSNTTSSSACTSSNDIDVPETARHYDNYEFHNSVTPRASSVSSSLQLAASGSALYGHNNNNNKRTMNATTTPQWKHSTRFVIGGDTNANGGITRQQQQQLYHQEQYQQPQYQHQSQQTQYYHHDDDSISMGHSDDELGVNHPKYYDDNHHDAMYCDTVSSIPPPQHLLLQEYSTNTDAATTTVLSSLAANASPYSMPPHQQQHREVLPLQREPRRQRCQRIEIGEDTRVLEKMVGVEDHGYKTPMIVLDGANIAYAYSSSLLPATSTTKSSTILPDPRGIRIACHYFEKFHLRVLVVLKQSYYTNATRNTTTSTANQLLQQQWYDVLYHYLTPRNMLVLAPSTDDDDAYCITIAQRENIRASRRTVQNGPGWAYILSNDQYRDAQQRQSSSSNNQPNSLLSLYLNNDVRSGYIPSVSNHNTAAVADESSNAEDYGPGRISYTFVDMGTIDDHGDSELDFVPNPRHALIHWIESQQQQRHLLDVSL